MNEIEAWKATGRRAIRIARQRWPSRPRALGPLLGLGALLGVATMVPHHAMSGPAGWREGRPFPPGHFASRTVDRPLGRPLWRGERRAGPGDQVRLAPPASPQAPALPEAPLPPSVPAAPAVPQAPAAPAAPVAPVPPAP